MTERLVQPGRGAVSPPPADDRFHRHGHHHRGGGRILNVTTGSGEVFRLPEEPPKLESWGEFSLAVPGYYASKRALDRLGNALAPELARKRIAVIGLMPGPVATEIVLLRIEP